MVTATAPGKLLLTGEYAVLWGAPALVASVNRRARVTETGPAPHDLEIHATQIDSTSMRLRFDADGPACVDVPAAGFSFVREALAAMYREGLLDTERGGRRISLSTTQLYAEAGNARTKLGIGSSAALTVALAGCLAPPDRLADARSLLPALIRVHRACQGGVGSGVDVASSLLGGFVDFRLDHRGRPHWTRLPAQPQIKTAVFWSGKATSTGDFVSTVNRWAKANPAEFDAHRKSLVAAAEEAVAGWRQDPHRFLAAARHFGVCLSLLGKASGVAIFSPEHDAMQRAAASLGAVYKPSGAGGGDVGVAFAAQSPPLAALAKQASGQGLICISADLGGPGMQRS